MEFKLVSKRCHYIVCLPSFLLRNLIIALFKIKHLLKVILFAVTFQQFDHNLLSQNLFILMFDGPSIPPLPLPTLPHIWASSENLGASSLCASGNTQSEPCMGSLIPAPSSNNHNNWSQWFFFFFPDFLGLFSLYLSCLAFVKFLQSVG